MSAPGAPIDYDGISHARLTRRMTQARVPPTARNLMAEVFRAIPVGRWGRLSNATLARRLQLSESTVSRGMALLVTQGFIARRLRADGPGYELSPQPPPELRPKPAPARAAESPAQLPLGAVFDPSINDPVGSIPAQGVPTPQSGAHEGSTVDGSIFYDHTCSSGMHGDSSENTKPDRPGTAEPGTGTPATPLLPPAPPEVFARYFAEYQWRRLLRVAPAGYGLPELARDVAKLRTRVDARWPWKLLVAALERGEPIYSQEELDARDAELRALASQAAPAGAPRPAGVSRPRGKGEAPYRDASAVDWAALRRAEEARIGVVDADGPPPELPAREPPDARAPARASPAPPAPDLEAGYAAALALLGDRPPAGAAERALLRERLAAGAPPEAAVAALWKRREPRPKRADRVFRPLSP